MHLGFHGGIHACAFAVLHDLFFFCECVCVHSCIQLIAFMRVSMLVMFTCVFMYAHTNVVIHAVVYMCVSMYACMHACIHACMRITMHVQCMPFNGCLIVLSKCLHACVQIHVCVF